MSVANECNHSLLRILQTRILERDFRVLSHEAGFQPPNNFDIFRIQEDLRLGRFPIADHYEYAWAIYECSRESLRALTPPMKVLLSALFVFCQKRTAWGVPIESEYFQLGLEAIFEINDPNLSIAYLSFLDWLASQVASDADYCGYFCLLASAYLRAHLSKTTDLEFMRTLDSLSAMRDKFTESELTVAPSGLRWWNEVSASCVGGDEALRRLISVLPRQ
jgi:hypothetical protein